MSIPISGYELASLMTSMCLKNLDLLLDITYQSETSFIEVKSDFEPFGGECEPGHNEDDYYWHVTKGLLALANSSGGVLIIGISESSGSFEPVELNIGRNFDKYLRVCHSKILHHKVEKGERPFSVSKWKTQLKSNHGIGVWSVDHNRLANCCYTFPCKFKEKPVLAVFVRPVAKGETPIVAEFEPEGSGKPVQCIYVRGKGNYGEARKITVVAEICEYQKTREINEPELFNYFMTFLDRLCPEDTRGVQLRKAQGLIQALREGRKLYFDPQPNVNFVNSPLSAKDIGPVDLILSGAGYPLAFTSMPFELGSTFGLDRGSYFLLTDAPFDRVHAALVRSEAIMRKELEAIGHTGISPERWWLRLDIAKCPAGPYSLEELFESRLDPDDELVKALKRLKQWRRTDDGRTLIPGVLLEIHAGQVQSLGEWCRQVFSRIDDFLNENLAVVVCIRTKEEASTQLKTLLTEVRAVTACHEDIPFFAGRWIGHPAPQAELTIEDKGSIFDAPPPPGVGVYTLLTHFRKKHGQTAMEQFHSRPCIQRIIDELKNRPDSQIEKTNINANDVVNDLESLDVWTTSFGADRKLRGELYQDILEIFGLFGTPDNKHQMVSKLARSNSDDIRMAALRFASRSDIFLDWWVEGAGDTEEWYPRIEQLIEFKPPHDQRPLLQSLVLAMLRGGKSTPGLLRLVEKLYKRFLLSDFRQLLEVPRHGIAVSQCTDALIPIAMLAAKSLDLSGFESIGHQGFSSPYLWWALQSIQVQREWLRKVIKLPAEKRAILGLVTRREFSSLAEDTLDSVREFRRGLPFSCFSWTLIGQQGDSSC